MSNFELPYPPTVNTYYRNWNGRMVISNKGRAYRQAVATVVKNVPRIESKLAVEIEACPPDRRRRDLDNLLKACLDALQHGGLYEDDFQICQLTIRRGDVVKNGLLKVSVRQVK